MSQTLSIFDTTLRDGEQAPGNAMTPPQKLHLAQEIAGLGVDVVEAGFPAASESDAAAVQAIARTLRGVGVCAFARAAVADIEAAARATEGAERPQLLMITCISEIHRLHKRGGMSRRQALDEATAATRHAAALGFADICIGPEDATRADPDFLVLMCREVVRAGATTIAIPDTVGCCLPDRMTTLVHLLRAALPPGTRIAVHAHDDLGLAVANTLAGIEAGVDEIHVTLCGVGERAGNAAFEEVLAALLAHPQRFARTTRLRPERTAAACRALIETLRLPLARGKAVIGENAFATAAGIHQAGVLRAPATYEFLDPATFGAERRMAISRHSGRAAVRAKLEMLGEATDDATVERVYAALTGEAQHRPLWSDSEIAALARAAD